jgi:hypothetical protein
MASLENPSIGTIALYSSDKPTKGDLLTEALQILALAQRSSSEAVLQGLTKGYGAIVVSRSGHL